MFLEQIIILDESFEVKKTILDRALKGDVDLSEPSIIKLMSNPQNDIRCKAFNYFKQSIGNSNYAPIYLQEAFKAETEIDVIEDEALYLIKALTPSKFMEVIKQ